MDKARLIETLKNNIPDDAEITACEFSQFQQDRPNDTAHAVILLQYAKRIETINPKKDGE